MKKTLLLALALAVTPAGVDAQVWRGTPYERAQNLLPCERILSQRRSSLQGDRSCAKQGSARYQYNLGVRYSNGEGVPEDDAEAVRLYRLAAEQGYAPAQTNLAWVYSNGEGVPEDDAEAARLYLLAAEQGYALAQNNLGSMYGKGEGVPEDDVRAYMWLNLAGAQGDENARRNKGIIEQGMTRAQITEGQRLSREWIAADPPPEEQDEDISAAPTSTPFTVAPDIQNRAEVIRAMEREYPPLLRDAGIGGTVQVYFFIDEEGTVQQFLINESSGYQELDDAALAVAGVYRFSPALNENKRVPVWVSFGINFQVR